MKNLAAAACLLLVSLARPSPPGSGGAVHPDSALPILKAGNARFVAGTTIHGPHAGRRAETIRSQHPFAVVVGCADSRTPPEILFDQGLGDLFVIRTAGNLVEDFALGSIEYAVEHLGTRLIVVMGHQRCGAVTAAMGDGRAEGHVRALVREIRPAVAATRGFGGDTLANAVRENARRAAAKVRDEAGLGELRPAVRVVTAYYDLETGAVEWDGE